MAFFQLALKARKLEKTRLVYQEEKMKSIEVSKGAKIRYTFFQRIRHKKILYVFSSPTLSQYMNNVVGLSIHF